MIDKINKIDKNKYLVISTICIIFSIVFSRNLYISLMFTILQVGILSKFLIKKNIIEFICYYIIFLSTSFEFEVLVGSGKFYGFKNFRIAGINIAVLILIPALLFVIVKGINIKKLKEKNILLYRFFIVIIALMYISIVTGLTNLLFDNNGILRIGNYLRLFLNEIYYDFIVLAITAIFIYAFVNEDNIEYKITSMLTSILKSIVIGMIVSIITNTNGTYGGVQTLLLPNVSFFIPLFILLPFYDKRNSVINIIYAIIGITLTLFYNATGKAILILLLCPIFILIILIRNKKYSKAAIYIILTPIILIIIFYIINILSQDSIILKSKFQQAMSLVEFWKPNWLDNMSDSPSYRVNEFINIFNEYLQQPLQIFVGKGYLGTFRDHIEAFSSVDQGSFSPIQYQYGLFFTPHSALNVIFLQLGMLGISLLTILIVTLIKNINKSFWLLIGLYWIGVMYGFSFTLTGFGLVSLLIGIVQSKQIQIKRGEYNECSSCSLFR